jgi:excisionase family DNA binding protein
MTPTYEGDTSPYPSPPQVRGDFGEPPEPPRPLLLTVKEAAALIGIGRTTLYQLMDSGEIASVHVGSSRRIPLLSVHEFVERLSRPTIDSSRRRSAT